MDLTLVTGQPGSGKTLNTIKDVEKRRQEESRPVYYFGIPELKLDWNLMEAPESLKDNPDALTPLTWFNAPDSAIIVIDECQRYYPAHLRGQHDFIDKMATYRHEGYSLYLITQGPKLVHQYIREWVQPHIHYRRIYGGDKIVRYINESCIDNPRSGTNISKNAIIKKITLDKEMFGLYKSSKQHNVNKRINVKLLLFIIIPLIALPSSIYFTLKKFGYFDIKEKEVAEVVQPVEIKQFSNNSNESLYENMQYFDPLVFYKPRIPAMPETAPAYDELRKPLDFPRPNCLMSAKKCLCYTQQASLMKDYPQEICKSIVKNGYFDSTKPRYEFQDKKDLNSD